MSRILKQLKDAPTTTWCHILKKSCGSKISSNGGIAVPWDDAFHWPGLFAPLVVQPWTARQCDQCSDQPCNFHPRGKLPTTLQDNLIRWTPQLNNNTQLITSLTFPRLLPTEAHGTYIPESLVQNTPSNRPVYRGSVIFPNVRGAPHLYFGNRGNLNWTQNRSSLVIVFTYPGQLNRWPCHSLTH